jgi:hypothetical protein
VGDAAQQLGNDPAAFHIAGRGLNLHQPADQLNGLFVPALDKRSRV